MDKLIFKDNYPHKIAIPNGELYYESIGNGEILIFIHAGFSDHREWEHQVEELSNYCQTIVYDQRGSGQSQW